MDDKEKYGDVPFWNSLEEYTMLKATVMGYKKSPDVKWPQYQSIVICRSQSDIEQAINSSLTDKNTTIIITIVYEK